MLKGVHTNAKSQWLDYLNNVMTDLIDYELPSDILNQLQVAATTITGIGPKTIDETWLYILEEKSKQRRGF